jgi:CRISPR type III-A-associated protein Csm2
MENRRKDNNRNENNFKDELESLILNPTAPGYVKFLLENAETYVDKQLSRSITKTQLRSLFELFRDCKTMEHLKMLKPKLIYTAGRLTGEGKNFVFSLSRVVMKAQSDDDCEHFKKFMETILAYHKYYAKN